MKTATRDEQQRRLLRGTGLKAEPAVAVNFRGPTPHAAVRGVNSLAPI